MTLVPRISPNEHRHLRQAYDGMIAEGRIATTPPMYAKTRNVFFLRRHEGDWYDATTSIITQQRHEEGWVKTYAKLKKVKIGA